MPADVWKELQSAIQELEAPAFDEPESLEEVAERHREEWRARYGYEAPETQVALHVAVEKLRRTTEEIRFAYPPDRPPFTLIRGGGADA